MKDISIFTVTSMDLLSIIKFYKESPRIFFTIPSTFARISKTFEPVFVEKTIKKAHMHFETNMRLSK